MPRKQPFHSHGGTGSHAKRGILFIICILFAGLVSARDGDGDGDGDEDTDYLFGPGDDDTYTLPRTRKADVVHSRKAIVASDDRRCSEIGVSMMRIHGSAVDAAIAAALCLGVVCQTSSGIGGGDFMVVRSVSGGVVAIDSRETAPAAASENMYDKNPSAQFRGPLSVAVPGEIAGLHTSWLKFGRLPWKTLFQPSIDLARHGFKVSPFLNESLVEKEGTIMSDPGLRQVYAPYGKLLTTGELCYNPELGNTLEEIAINGPDAFYNGTVGKKLVKDVRKGGGILTLDDLKNYKVRVKEPITMTAMGYKIYGMPPPSSGTLGLALILHIMQSYHTWQHAFEGPLGLHRLIEALKHMFAIRMDLGDPDFVDIEETMAMMVSREYAEMIRDRIKDNTTFPPEYYYPKWKQQREGGTSHLCVIDQDRNAVSLTSTVNHYFGSGVLSPSTGIVLNNEMDDFSIPNVPSNDELPPAPANFIRPNKRPLSSMTPLIVLRKNHLIGVIGGSGGINIIPGVTQLFVNHFILRMGPLAAMNNSRIYHWLMPNVVLYEKETVFNGGTIELPEERRAFLKERNHDLQAYAAGAHCQLVVQNLKDVLRVGNVVYGMLTAVSDPRKGGQPSSYAALN